MKERECPSCAMTIDAEADVCPYCGYDLPKEKSSVKVVAVVMALLLAYPLFKLLGLLFG